MGVKMGVVHGAGRVSKGGLMRNGGEEVGGCGPGVRNGGGKVYS